MVTHMVKNKCAFIVTSRAWLVIASWVCHVPWRSETQTQVHFLRWLFLLDNVRSFTPLPHVAKWVPHFMHVCFLHCKNKLVILTMEWLPQLQTNWREWLPEVCMLWYCSSSYNHNTLTTLRTSVRESPACTKSKKVPYCNFEVHL